MGQVTHELGSAPKTTDAAQNSLEENDESLWNLHNRRRGQHFRPSQIAASESKF